MKRIFTAILFVFMISAVTVVAGDIPESYLCDEAVMFFGEVVYYHPEKDAPSIQVSPVKKIKGEVKEGSLQTYTNPNIIGDIKIKKDEIYLFAYVDNVNGIDVFEVTSYDTKTLKLKNVEGDMWDRFEKYMNEGKYGVSEVEGRKTPADKRKSTSTVIAVAVALVVGVTGGTMTFGKRNEGKI